MRKATIVLLVALVAGLLSFTMTSPAQADEGVSTPKSVTAQLQAEDAAMSSVSRASAVFAATHYCDTDSQVLSGAFTYRYDLYWAARHYFRACRPYDPQDHYGYITPRWTVYSYNREGSHMTCNRWLRFLNSVDFNLYTWRPYSGANYNPGEVKVPCDESTINSDTQTHNTTIKLYFGPGNGSDRQPRWKVNVKENLAGDDDRNTSKWRKYSLLIN